VYSTCTYTFILYRITIYIVDNLLMIAY